MDYQHIDLGPTLTDLLGLPSPTEADGVSAFSTERPQRDNSFHGNYNTFVYSDEDDSCPDGIVYYSNETEIRRLAPEDTGD